MGMVYADIILTNAADSVRARDGYLKENEIRQVAVRALVDTGASDLVINEATRARLGLNIKRKSFATLADGSKQEYQVTEPVEIRFKDRDAITNALVLPTADEVLLGALPLEAMDLMIHPKKLELSGVHGDKAQYIVYHYTKTP